MNIWYLTIFISFCNWGKIIFLNFVASDLKILLYVFVFERERERVMLKSVPSLNLLGKSKVNNWKLSSLVWNSQNIHIWHLRRSILSVGNDLLYLILTQYACKLGWSVCCLHDKKRCLLQVYNHWFPLNLITT